MTNEAMGLVMDLFLDPAAAAALGPATAMRRSYQPRALRPYSVNWEATAAAFIQWLHRDLLRTGDARRAASSTSSCPTPTCRASGRRSISTRRPRRFSRSSCARTTRASASSRCLGSLGTPYDITLHELRIECFFAADAATEAALRRLSEAGGSTR